MSRRKQETDNNNHERWLVSYADFITRVSYGEGYALLMERQLMAHPTQLANLEGV